MNENEIKMKSGTLDEFRASVVKDVKDLIHLLLQNDDPVRWLAAVTGMATKMTASVCYGTGDIGYIKRVAETIVEGAAALLARATGPAQTVAGGRTPGDA